MKLKYRELKTCSKICRMPVRLVVRLRCSVDYDESRNERKNDPNQATNEIFLCQTPKIKYFNAYINFWMSRSIQNVRYARKCKLMHFLTLLVPE
ncbi:hypothetical protein Hanom_Chr06g00507681 [Helianthus anomalus]